MEVAGILMTHADKSRFATGLGTKDPRSNTTNSTTVNLVNFLCHFQNGNSAPMNEDLSTINDLQVLMRKEYNLPVYQGLRPQQYDSLEPSSNLT